MICNNCGKEIEDDSEFCYFCGSDTANTAYVEFEDVGFFDKKDDSEDSYSEITNNLMNLIFNNPENEFESSKSNDSEAVEEAHRPAYNCDFSNIKCHLCGGEVIPGKIEADRNRDFYDLIADGTFICDNEELGVFESGGMRIHLSGPACFCPRCKVITGFFNAN
ncbi:MAG: zinc-ribbon domain-containing protein [Lachnospiraceae bacterium]|nr:zinc-ribbon domain-containing protein [Lachnospiraceae bacterium]